MMNLTPLISAKETTDPLSFSSSEQGNEMQGIS